MVRPTAGEDVGGREDLERAQEVDDPQVEGDRREQWPADVAEAAPRPRPVELGRLVELARDRLQGREVDEHVHADAGQTEQDQRRHGPRLAVQPPGTGDADLRQELVREPEARVEQPAPEEGHRDAGEHRRQEDDRAEEADAGPRAPQQQRQPEADGEAGRDDAGGVGRGVRQAAEEEGVAAERGVVVESHEAHRRGERPVGERHPDHRQQRAPLEEEEADQPGGDQEVEPALAGAGEGARSGAHGTRSPARVSLSTRSISASASGTGVSPRIILPKRSALRP